MRYSILSGFLFYIFAFHAQQLRTYDSDSAFTGKQLILLNGVLDYSSSSLRNAVMSPLIIGGYIDSAAKAKSFDPNKSYNTLGFEANATYAHYFSCKDKEGFPSRWMLGATLGTAYAGSLRYSTDLYSMAFYGNSAFQGKYVDFTNTEASYIQYQTLGVGLFDRLTQSSVSVNIVGVNNYFKARLGDQGPMKFYYSEQGDSIYGLCNASLSRTSSPAYFKGLGLSLSGDYRFRIANEETGKVASMQFSVSNFGLAYINELNSQTLDTSFAYGGFTLSEIVNREGLLAPGFSYSDSLLTSETKGKWVLLPASVQVFSVVNVLSTARFQPTYGFKIMFLSGYLPYVYAGIVTKIVPKLHLGTCASYGGFSGFKMNASIHYASKRIQFGVGTDNLLGLMLRNAFGKSLSIRLRCDL